MKKRDKVYKTRVRENKKSGDYIAYRPSNETYERITDEYYPRDVLMFDVAINTQHVSQKPIPLFEYLINTYTLKGQIVVDPFSGSGTTAIASRNLDRRFMCCDISQKYVDMGNNRLATSDPLRSKPIANGAVQKSIFDV
jgi:site-specific DNA-methyltransferase (adenine-specific)